MSQSRCLISCHTEPSCPEHPTTKLNLATHPHIPIHTFAKVGASSNNSKISEQSQPICWSTVILMSSRTGLMQGPQKFINRPLHAHWRAFTIPKSQDTIPTFQEIAFKCYEVPKAPQFEKVKRSKRDQHLELLPLGLRRSRSSRRAIESIV